MIVRDFPWPPNTKFIKLNQSNVKYIVIHHTAKQGNTTPEEVNQWHKNKGWVGIGYHRFIERDGTITRCRPLYAQGAHVYGHNHESWGVCLAGDFRYEKPTKAQMESLTHVLKDDLLKIVPTVKIVGHKDLYLTECPGDFPWAELWRRLRGGEVDMELTDYEKKLIEEVTKSGIIVGDGTLESWDKPLTRLDMAKILHRLNYIRVKED